MGKKIRRIIMGMLLIIFIGSTGVILYTKQQYRVSEELYSQASEQYTVRTEETGADTGRGEPASAPVMVDFDALQAENEDIIGWIYCEGTPIDYLVVQGPDNDYYLRRSYDGVHSTAGTIFIDANNRENFADCNTIVYGHNMKNGSMFAVLSSWQEQMFYEEHPIIWFLTPKRDYKIVLLSGRTVSAHSDVYMIYKEPCEEFDAYVQDALAQSDFQPVMEPEGEGNYVLLSTCSYVFDDARYVLLGQLVPAESAGGKRIVE